jgi:hypothetical protein
MKAFHGPRRFNWPVVDVYGSRSRGDIKVISVQELEYLTKLASGRWSANGRPDWLKNQRDHVVALMLTVLGLEGRAVYRCLVMAVLDDKTRYSFTLDVSFDEFDRLDDMPLKDVVSLAHRYLLDFPHLDLDPAQKDSWCQIVDGDAG